MRYRMARAALLALFAITLACRAQAQVASAEVGPGFSYQLVPYVWLPWIDTTAKIPVPGGGTATTTVSAGPGAYIPKINFAFMGAGEVRYDRFSVLTDLVYLNASTTSSKLKSVDFAGISIPVSAFLATSTSTRIASTVWTLAGGYTLAHANWGNVDVIGGFRLLAISERTNFSLSAGVIAPDGEVALTRFGGVSASRDIWNGIVGVRGRVYLADSTLLSGGRFLYRSISTLGRVLRT